MNKALTIFAVFVLSLTITSVLSQNKNEVAITGTVYVSSSTSMGTLNGGSITEPQHPFKKQPIYFKNDSTTVKGTTDSLGIFSVKLKEGMYTVYQEEGLKKGKNGMEHYDSRSIEVKNGNSPFQIIFHNSSNRRSTLNSGMPGSGKAKTKTTKKSKQE